MKTLVVMLLAMPVLAIECEKGCLEYQGNCACDVAPEAVPAPQVRPSDEKPPKDKMPSYQRVGVHADLPSSLIADDEKQDKEIMSAKSTGIRAAGLNK